MWANCVSANFVRVQGVNFVEGYSEGASSEVGANFEVGNLEEVNSDVLFA